MGQRSRVGISGSRGGHEIYYSAERNRLPGAPHRSKTCACSLCVLEGGAAYNRLSRCLITELFYCGLVRRERW